MDQIDHTSSIDIQQQALSEMMKQNPANDLSYLFSINYSDQLNPENHDNNVSLAQSSNAEYEQDENDQLSMPIVYRKRVRTKFNREQLDVLESTFQQHRYPTVDIIDDLVEQLQLPTQKITIWFQNRRARLKKSQQKIDEQVSYEKEDQKHYDSGIHLDDNASRDSSLSPPSNSLVHFPSAPVVPQPFIPTPTPTPYYLPDSHHSFYSSMWPNFRYPFPLSSVPSLMVNTPNMSYNLMNYNVTDIPTPDVFQNISNYQHEREFNDGL